MTYSPLPPSSAARRVACPGSKALEEMYRSDERSPSAYEGEAAHWLAMLTLSPGDHGVPRRAPNGEVITQEMREGAILWHDTVMPGCFGVYAALNVEKRIDISVIHPDCWGIPDCWHYNYMEKRLYVYEYKFGRRPVEVISNWQMIEYAAGIIHTRDLPKDSLVNFVIVQPRAHHNYLGKVRTWQITVDALIPYFNVLRETERIATSENAPCRPSPECNYCAGRHACRALRNTSLTLTDSLELNIPRPLNGEELGSELKYLQRSAQMLNARITGLEAEAETRLKKGETVVNYRLQEGQGKEVWDAGIEDVKVLGELYDVNLSEEKLITPKQAIKAGIPDTAVRKYSKTYSGSMKLTPVDEAKNKWIFGSSK